MSYSGSAAFRYTYPAEAATPQGKGNFSIYSVSSRTIQSLDRWIGELPHHDASGSKNSISRMHDTQLRGQPHHP